MMTILENASDGIHAEIQRRSGRIKQDLGYISKILKKIARWTGEESLEKDIETIEVKIDRIVSKSDALLDDMFDNL